MDHEKRRGGGSVATRRNSDRLGAQTVGAYGEKVVEAELLRRGWVPSNVNASIKNAAEFDIFALKQGRLVCIRVKTCGADMNAFQFGGFRPGLEIASDRLADSDFTILVRMGATRQEDLFYVIPTHVVRRTIGASRSAYLKQEKRAGGQRKDTGHWTLHLADLRSGEDRPSHGFARKWAVYCNNWDILEVRKNPSQDQPSPSK